MAKNKVIETTVDELIPDNKNFNKGNEYGESLIEKSFQQFGAGRGISIDKNNRIISGNKSTQKFVETGNKKVIIVETTGDTLIVNKRTDIDLDTKIGREMALADNATAMVNITFDEVVINDVCTELDINIEEWGVNFELENVEVKKESSENDLSENININYRLEIICESEQIQQNLYTEFKQRGLQCKVLTL